MCGVFGEEEGYREEVIVLAGRRLAELGKATRDLARVPRCAKGLGCARLGVAGFTTVPAGRPLVWMHQIELGAFNGVRAYTIELVSILADHHTPGPRAPDEPRSDSESI